MREHELTVEWPELLAAAARGEISAGDRQRLLDHLADCESCRRALESVRHGPHLPAATARLAAERSDAVRARLLARAASDREIERATPSIWRGLPPGAGWLVAAGLATLLFSHHAFHRPLQLGWVVAGILAIACFGLGLQAFAQLREVRELRQRLAELARRAPTGSD